MVGQLIQKKEEEKRIEEEQAAKDRYWKILVCYDDEESSIPLKDIIIAGLPSYELIKSSVEDLVQIPSESEDSSEGGCDLPPYDDSLKNHTFPNPLFNIDERIIYLDDESFPQEDVPMRILKSSLASLDLEEEITSLKFNSENPTESFSPSPIPIEDSDFLMEEIDIFLDGDGSIPLGIESDDFDSENDDNSTSHFNFIPSNDLGSDLDDSSPFGDRNKIYDPGICIEVESTKFLSTLSPVIDTLLPFSSKNEDKVFNHGVLASKEKSPFSSSHRGLKASKLFHQKSPMLIHGDNTPNLGVRHPHFYPP
ncbi:hypothetical protein Tco_0682131 [Tanacetum coccineum]|uniref:Uncharacterized protein n=1 Tax=Tanacetum coccineum TaxID=301880 RepID=A0ABQ4XRA9_9ASTR